MEKKKKKAPVSELSDAEDPKTEIADQSATVVTQVVEVIEVNEVKTKPTSTGVIEKEQTMANEVTDQRPELEEVGNGSWADDKIEIDTNSVVPGKKSSESESKSREVNSKEVVEELFSKRDADSLTEISIHKKNRQSPLMWAVIMIVVAVITGAGLITLTKSTSIGSVISVKPTPTPSPAPSPTPQTLLKREDISIQVLNGGGQAGAATKMKNVLVEKGYKVTDVGNTDEYNYQNTEILIKSGKETALSLLKDDLKDTYSLGTDSANLPADTAYDVRVIVGKE
jgi:hypothetical protein